MSFFRFEGYMPVTHVKSIYSLLQLNSNDQSNNSDILLTLDPCNEKKNDKYEEFDK